MGKEIVVGCIFALLLPSMIFLPQTSFAKNSLQDGLWDFDYVGMIVSDNQLIVGQEMEIEIPVFNKGTEVGSVLISITLQDSVGNTYYGETKIFDIPPLSKDYPSAKFNFIPETSESYSINVVIHTPDTEHIFDSSPQGLFLNTLEVGQTNDLPGIPIIKLYTTQSQIIEDIPPILSAEASSSNVDFSSSEVIDQSKLIQLENELKDVKGELANVKKDMSIKGLDNNLILFSLLIGITIFGIYLIMKYRKQIKSVLVLLVAYYKQPVQLHHN